MSKSVSSKTGYFPTLGIKLATPQRGQTVNSFSSCYAAIIVVCELSGRPNHSKRELEQTKRNGGERRVQVLRTSLVARRCVLVLHECVCVCGGGDGGGVIGLVCSMFALTSDRGIGLSERH